MERGQIVTRIVSDDPQLSAILRGTEGPYNEIPPYGPGTELGGWGARHGFTTKRAMYFLARSIAKVGSRPAGTFEGKQDWIKEAIREVNR